MPRRELVFAWIAGFFAGLPVVVLGSLFDWPAISFLGALLVSGVIFFAVFDRVERNARIERNARHQ
jgi:hypothetical protein